MKKFITLSVFMLCVFISYSQTVVVNSNNSYNASELESESLFDAQTLSLSGTWAQENIDQLKGAIQISKGTSTSLLSVDMSNVVFDGDIILDDMFIGASNLKEVIFPVVETSGIVSFNNTFFGCKKLLVVKNFQNFTNISQMDSTFSSCESLTYIMLSTLPTEAYTDTFGSVNPNALYYLPENYGDVFDFSYNVIVGNEAKLEVSIESTSPYYCPQAFATTDGATYSYYPVHAESESWNTIVFPFVPENVKDVYNDFISVDIANYRGLSQSNICFSKLSSLSEIVASKPYIIGSNGSNNKLKFTSNNCEVPASDNINYESIDKLKFCTSTIVNELKSEDYPMVLNEQGVAFTFASQSGATQTAPFECYFVLEEGAKIDKSLAISTDESITTDTERIVCDEDNVYAAKGMIMIKSNSAKTIKIYNIEGELISTLKVKAGDNEFDTPSGLYIINNKLIFVR